MNPKIFISHRHVDRPIADILRQSLMDWSTGHCEIFQSSDQGTIQNIDKGIQDKLVKVLILSETELLILVYTHPDEDWSWCMWECGIAVDLTATGPETRIVVLQCADKAPTVFGDRDTVQLDLESIRRFTVDFHKSAGFFPKHPAFAHDIPADILEMRAHRLYEELQSHAAGVLPSQVKGEEGQTVEGSSIVFLCYSSADKPTVRTLYHRLRNDRFRPWLDEEDLLGGQKWRDEIPKVLRTSDAVIVCLSHSCVTKSGFVQREI